MLTRSQSPSIWELAGPLCRLGWLRKRALVLSEFRRSGDDVGQELIFDLGDLIFERELLFFNLRIRSWSAAPSPLEGYDLVVEGPMLRTKLDQQLSEFPSLIDAACLPARLVTRTPWTRCYGLKAMLPGRTIVSFFSLRKHRRARPQEKPSHVDG